MLMMIGSIFDSPLGTGHLRRFGLVAIAVASFLAYPGAYESKRLIPLWTALARVRHRR